MSSAPPAKLDAERLKRETRPELVLEQAKARFGIDPTKYTTSVGKDGSPRIIHGGKQYNLGDFYTKHLKVEWKVAASSLEEVWRAGQADRVPGAKKNLWGAYMQQRAADKLENQVERRRVQTTWQNERAEIRSVYKRAVSGGRVSHQVKATARAERLGAEDRARRNAQEKFLKLRPQSRAEGYRAFLAKIANKGDLAALTELRRLAPVEPAAPIAILGRGKDQASFPLPAYSVDRTGAVTYRIENRSAVIDSSRQVRVVQATDRAYEAALRVAVARYGKALTLHGDDRFISGIAEAAKRNKINVTIHRADRPTQAPLVIQPRVVRGERPR